MAKSKIAGFMMGKWETGKPMRKGKYGFGCIALGDNIYCIGGYEQGETGFSASVDIYNTKSNTWYSGKPVPYAKDLRCTVFNEKIYCFLYDLGNIRVFVYDNKKDSWTDMGSEILHGGQLGTVFTVGNMIHFHYTYNISDPMYYIYDPTKNEWRQHLELRDYFPTNTGCGFAIANNKRFYIGGANGVNYTSSVDRNLYYDLESNEQSYGSSMPTARRNFSIGVLDNHLFCIGGSPNGADSNRYHEIYNTITDKWLEGFNIPTSRYDFGCAVVNGKLYCIGGRHKEVSFLTLDSVEILTPGEIISMIDTKTITHKYQKVDGSSIYPNNTHNAEVEANYTAYALSFKGYNCTGFKLDEGVFQSGTTVTIKNVLEEHTITFIYEEGDPAEGDRVTITANYQTQGGNAIKSDTFEFAQKGTTYNLTAPIILGYMVTGYKLDAGLLNNATTATIEKVQSDRTITFVYKEDNGTDPGIDPNINKCHCCAKVKIDITGCSDNKLLKDVCKLIQDSECDCACVTSQD